MKISVDVKGIDRIVAQLGGLRKQVNFATAVALTKTAQHAQKLQYDEFRQKFDRPTPAVMKSLYIKPAKKDRLEAMLYMKNKAMGGKNPRSMSEILGHHFAGGRRVRKALEDALRRFGYLADGEMVVPGAAATLDRYGNMSRGQLNKILSQLAVGAAGYDNRPTGSQRSQRNVSRTGRIFWSYGSRFARRPLVDKATGITYGYSGMPNSRANHLPKGAWVAVGRSVKPLLLVINDASYRRAFDLEKTARRAVAERFDAEFDRALANAMRTAR